MINPLVLFSSTNHKVKLVVPVKLDNDNELKVWIDNPLSAETAAYITRTQVTELRDHLTTILKTPEPMYRYLIKEFNDTPHGVISTGTVDKVGLELLKANTPAGHVIKYELIPN
jgi:hypothetical protein